MMSKNEWLRAWEAWVYAVGSNRHRTAVKNTILQEQLPFPALEPNKPVALSDLLNPMPKHPRTGKGVPVSERDMFTWKRSSFPAKQAFHDLLLWTSEQPEYAFSPVDYRALYPEGRPERSDF